MRGERRGKEDKARQISVDGNEERKAIKNVVDRQEHRYYIAKHKSAAPIDKLEKSKTTSPTSHRKYRA